MRTIQEIMNTVYDSTDFSLNSTIISGTPTSGSIKFRTTQQIINLVFDETKDKLRLIDVG